VNSGRKGRCEKGSLIAATEYRRFAVNKERTYQAHRVMSTGMTPGYTSRVPLPGGYRHYGDGHYGARIRIPQFGLPGRCGAFAPPAGRDFSTTGARCVAERGGALPVAKVRR
jgi:hypothetical protein